MLEFMHNFNTVIIFLVLVFSMVILAILAAIEIYDRVTGSDDKMQAELARLRQLEDEDDEGMYPR